MDKRMSMGVDLLDDVLCAYTKKAEYPKLKTLVLSILSGMFIAVGAYAASIAAFSIENPSVAKVLAGVVFPVGLLLVIFLGTDLFTGNTMILTCVFDKKVKFSKAITNMGIVFLGNLIGAIFLATLVYNSGIINGNAKLVDYIFKVAATKMTLSPVNILFSGIGCNLLVCGTIIMAAAAKDVAGKALVSYIGILVFVVTGFEHCVANMYYLTIGLLCKSNAAISVLTTHPEKLDHISFGGAVYNLIFATTGNILGGGILLGGMLFLGYKKFAVHKEVKSDVKVENKFTKTA